MDAIVKILLVEDDTLDVMDARRTLDKMGVLHIMHVAKNGEEALQYLRQVKTALPDVILLDLNMPKMNGIELLGHLKNRNEWRNIKTFILTTSGENEDKEQVRKLGVSGYLVKPLKLNNPSNIDSFNLMIDLLNIKNRI